MEPLSGWGWQVCSCPLPGRPAGSWGLWWEAAGLGAQGRDGGPFQAGKNMLRKGKRDKGQHQSDAPEELQDRSCPSAQGEVCVGAQCGPPEGPGWLGGCAVDATGISPGEASGLASAPLPRGHCRWASPTQGVTVAQECPSAWGSAPGCPGSCPASATPVQDLIPWKAATGSCGVASSCVRGPGPGLVHSLGLPQTFYPNHTQWKSC